MNPIDAYLGELEHESVATRRLIEAVPEDKWNWKANDKAMSLAELCGHLAGITEGMPNVIGGVSFDISQRPGPAPAPANRDAAVEQFDAAVRGAQEWLAGLGDAAMEKWTLTNGDTEVMSMPRVAAIRTFLFNHLYHHRGQLSAYLRAAGAHVPSVYGPTADENPFD